MAEQRKNEMHSTIKTLEETCDELTRKVQQLENEIEEMNRRDEDERKRDQKAHEDQVEFLKALNSDYNKDLEQQLAMAKK